MSTQPIPPDQEQRPEGTHLKYAGITGYTVKKKEGVPLVTITIAVHGDSLEAVNELFRQREDQDWFIVLANRTLHGELVNAETGESYGPADPPSSGKQLGMLAPATDSDASQQTGES